MEEEVEILQTIYADDIISFDLKCKKPFLEFACFPHATDDEENKRKTIRFDLNVFYPMNYPDEVPEFRIKHAKGITDDDVAKIQEEIMRIAEDNIGSQMLFEIIQFIKDRLSSFGNVPKSFVCSICLEQFAGATSSEIAHLSCYHYFHPICLNTYIKYMEAEIDEEKREAKLNKIKWKERGIVCPVCREAVNCDYLDELSNRFGRVTLEMSSYGKTQLADRTIVISEKMRALQQEMQALKERQMAIGGIIDLSRDQEIIVMRRPTERVEEEAATSQVDNNQQSSSSTSS